MGYAHLGRDLCIPTALELAVPQDRIHLPSCSAQHAGALLRSQHFCLGEAAWVGARIRALLHAELLSFPPSVALSETERGEGMHTSRASLQPSILRGTELHAGSFIAILSMHSAPSGLLELLAPSSYRCHPHGPLRWGGMQAPCRASCFALHGCTQRRAGSDSGSAREQAVLESSGHGGTVPGAMRAGCPPSCVQSPHSWAGSCSHGIELEGNRSPHSKHTERHP